MRKFISIGCILFFVIVTFGIEKDDSLWVNIVDVKPHMDKVGKVNFWVQWSVYDSPFRDSTYGDWYLVEDEKFKFLALCAEDSQFKKIIYSDSTDANNIVFDGLDVDKEYYLKAEILGVPNPIKSGVASGGYFSRYARTRQARRELKFGKFYITIGISLFIIILGLGVILFYLIRQNRKPKQRRKNA